MGKGRRIESCGSPASGKSCPMVPQCLADEGSWMEPWLGSAGPANLSSLHLPFQGSMAWGGEGAILPPLPGTLA